MSKKEMAPINYKGTDEQLHDALLDRGLFIPQFDGKFDRKRAIRALQNWETTHPDRQDRKCRVVFNYSRHANANSKYAEGCLNGDKKYFPYDVEVEVSENFLKECMDRAEEIGYVNQKDDRGHMTSTQQVTKTKIYPYTFLGYVEDKPEPKEPEVIKNSISDNF